jgi:polar amino acid transport system substrate-binding protein
MPLSATRTQLFCGIIAVICLLGGSNHTVPVRGEEKPKVLIFCAEATAMPRTGKAADGSPQGLDVAVARLVCEQLGRTFEIHWCANPACSRNCLHEKRCDVILGHPLDEGAPKEIAWSVPYAGSQFGLVVTRETQGIRSMADLVGKRLGVVAGTVALPESKHTLVRYQTREEVLDRFATDKLDAAFVDADFASWHLHSHPQLNLHLVADYVPREHWNMAFAARASDDKLVVEMNRAVTELARSGALQKTYAERGVSYRPPFTGRARKTAAVDTWKRIQDRGELRIGMDPANLPYSSASDQRPGFDLELARELAREIGLKLRVEWLDVQRETALSKLLQNECDLALGAAVDPNAVEDEEELADKVSYSRAYYGTGYLLVTRRERPRVNALADLKGETSRRLGTEAGSVADYRLRQGGYQRSLFRNQLAVLKALESGTIDYAYLWANVGWTLHATPEFKLQIVPNYTPEDHWNIAVAMRKGDAELKRRVDMAVEKLASDGTVARTLARYHVPFFPPFNDDMKEVSQSGTRDTGVIRHAVASRGPEPQMQKLQVSRHPYSGLARIRSAGALVVGLDQNNLPFSTAHPEPAGLDYEIAQLLAEKLGVSLQVYWAYSSHDSYPSKLATKKLCDVILGVMPDDRFGDRVLFTKPYYVASYQLVVPARADAIKRFDQLAAAPLAIESGVALRGLQGRATQTYPSLKSVLAAVEAGQIQAGYVISTHGHWLAQRRDSRALRFLDGDSADRFPICAAVRKSDRDLQAAIDAALDELAQSGKLQDVFARWHVPFAMSSKSDTKQPATRGGKSTP